MRLRASRSSADSPDAVAGLAPPLRQCDRVDAEVGGDLFQRDAGLAIRRDPYDILAELLRIRLGHCNILPGRLSASQVRCHLSVQQSLATITPAAASAHTA